MSVAPPRSFDWGGGRILVRQTHLPPNYDFSSDFGHFILKILKNLKFLVSYLKQNFKNRYFGGGGRPPSTFWLGGRVPRPPGVGAHVWCVEVTNIASKKIDVIPFSLYIAIKTPITDIFLKCCMCVFNMQFFNMSYAFLESHNILDFVTVISKTKFFMLNIKTP